MRTPFLLSPLPSRNSNALCQRIGQVFLGTQDSIYPTAAFEQQVGTLRHGHSGLLHSAREIADFHDTYGDLQARLVQAKSGAPWLGGRRSGYAVESAAPPRLMTLLSGRWTSVWSPLGTVQVRPLGPPLPLGTLPLGNAREAIRAALKAQEREDRYPTWLADAQQAAFPEAICWRDQMPEKGEVDLTNYLPFLALTS